MATKIFKTKRVIYRVVKNENGTLDRPIMVAGQEGTMFQYGAPRGHLTKYERIVDWE